MTRITSTSNDYFKRWKSLSTSKGLREENEFFLMGEKLITEFLRNPGLWKIKAEVRPEGLPDLPRSRGFDAKTFELPSVLFKEIDVLGTKFNLLLIEIPLLEPADLSLPPRGLEVVCPLGDPSNLGALTRSALAFGASRMILTQEACHPFHPKSVKASAGAVLKMPFRRVGPLKDYVSAGPDYALELGGENLNEFSWPQDLRLLVGEEGPGLPDLRGVKKLSIPTKDVESLNATVAASIALAGYASKFSN